MLTGIQIQTVTLTKAQHFHHDLPRSNCGACGGTAMRFWQALIVLIALYATVAQGAVFQYTAPVATSKGERGLPVDPTAPSRSAV